MRWQPTDDTTVDLMVYRFGEKDNRARIQKQLCDTDPLGILGCLPSKLTNGVTNANAGLGGIITSKQFFAFNGLGAVGNILALGDLNSSTNSNSGLTNSPNLREVNTAFTPQDVENEQQYMGRVKHDFGGITGQLSGMYQTNDSFSQLDYNMQASNPASYLKGLQGLQTLSGVLPFLKPVANLLIPNGPNGPYCSSLPDPIGGGIFGAKSKSVCASVPLTNDEISGRGNSITAEAIVSSQFDGPFNFLAGAIYINSKSTNVSYYVAGFPLDYASGVLGSLIAATATPTAPTGLPGLSALTPSNVGPSSSYLATPFFRSHADRFTLTSTGIFAESYYQVDDKLKVTVGVRYNNDKKFVKARATLFNCLNPIGTDPNLNCPTADFDQNTPGRQEFAVQSVKFGVFTGRAVVDYKITDENLIYASYSRGYKSGGINPPLSPGSTIPTNFSPEFVNAFEIGSKNTFLDGKMRANVTAFYYQYKGLQLSSIQERTSVNQNINATIYGLEGEFLFQPLPAFTINMNASYLHTAVAGDRFLINPADPSGGRSDAVIIKDITNASNCAVVPNVAGSSAAISYVTMTNNMINATKTTDLKGPVAFPTGRGLPDGVTGAYSVCSTLAASAAANNVSVAFNGVQQNVRDNQLPQAPTYKFSVGAQYVIQLPEGLSITPRADFAYTGKSFGSIHNTNVNRVPSYYIVNAQIQINGADNLWYGRAYVQNALNNNAITGLYVSDQSTGLFSNIFTLEPRRYGASIGFRF